MGDRRGPPGRALGGPLPAGPRGRSGRVRAGRRRRVALDPVAKNFGSAADAYHRARPGWPREAIAAAFAAFELDPPSAEVLDLAAGTGRLTRELAATGAAVTSVEPVAEMRALIEGDRVLDGTAESIPVDDGACDAVFVGEAFHWFDSARALPEIARVLRPRGGLAVMWNAGEWEFDNPSWRPEVVELIAPVYRHPKGHEVPSASGNDWRKDLSWQAEPGWELFEPLDMQSFEHLQTLTADDYVTLVSSWSFVAALDEPERAELLDSVAAVLERHGVESFEQRWRTDLYLTTRRH